MTSGETHPTNDADTPREPPSAEAVGRRGDSDGWPQLSELDLDVCLSAGLPREREKTEHRGSRPSRPQA